MALQEVCGFRDTPIYPKWNDLASFFIHGGDTAMHFHGGISSDLTGRGFPLWLYTPVQEYLTQSPLEFGQIRPSVSPSHFLPSSLPSISLPSSLPPSLSPHSTSVSLPFPLSHGTTTLAFVFSGGIIAAADTRSSCAGLVACPASDKVVPVHSHLVGTTSGTSADCFVWKRILARELRLYALRHRRRLSIRGAAKLLSNMLHPFKGTELCVAATLCGWDLEDGEVRVEVQGGEGRREEKEVKKEEEERPVGMSEAMDGASEMQRKTEKTKKERSSLMERGASSQLSTRGQHSSPEGEAGCNDSIFSTRGHSNIAGGRPLHPRSGPSLHYVCSDGSFLKGELFSVGSGSPYAYSVLDGSMLRGMGVAEACRLAREAVYRATHRDAYSGNCVDLYHVTAQGWRRREREDLKEEFYREREREREKVEERKKEREGDGGGEEEGE